MFLLAFALLLAGVRARGEIKISSIVDGMAIGCGFTHTLQWT